MVLDATLFNTLIYKVRIKRKELCPSLHLGVVAIENGAYDYDRQLYEIIWSGWLAEIR